MRQFLQQIDQFGTEEKLQIHPSHPVQKSSFGGIMTIILYGASLAYFFSELIDWIEINKLPKITSFQKQINKSETVQLKGRFFEVSRVSLASDNDTDPFDPQNMILYPQVKKYTQNPLPYEFFDMRHEEITLQGGNKINKFYLENEQIIGSPANGEIYNDQTYFEIQFEICQQSLLPSGRNCADETQIKNYKQWLNYIQISFFISEYDTKTKQEYKIEKYQQKIMSMELVQFYQFNLQVSNLNVDDGILFNNFNQFSFISDFSVETQQVDPNKFHSSTPLIIQLNLGQVKKVILIEYQKISEILANTGSIISWILSLSLIVQQYNKKLGQENIINEVIKLYYPDFENLSIKTNWYGKFMEIKLNSKQYDVNKVEKILTNVKQIAQRKINYLSTQYELSRFIFQQFRLQSLLTQQLGLNIMKNNHTLDKKIENLVDTCCYKIKIQQPISESVINFNNSCEINLQDIRDQDKINQQETSDIEFIDSTIGLFVLKNSTQKESTRQNQLEMNQQIYPKEELKQEEISRLNSQH